MLRDPGQGSRDFAGISTGSSGGVLEIVGPVAGRSFHGDIDLEHFPLVAGICAVHPIVRFAVIVEPLAVVLPDVTRQLDNDEGGALHLSAP